uniref:Uncharacterized protein n=1 Tax=Romanomermis culicivorax TaxID=13658 RepID=A0A915JV33_ROMCU
MQQILSEEIERSNLITFMIYLSKRWRCLRRFQEKYRKKASHFGAHLTLASVSHWRPSNFGAHLTLASNVVGAKVE